jgi:hypothetical protein
VAGGASDEDHLDTCEQYDILGDRWTLMDTARLPAKLFAMNLIPVHKRYVFGFGMLSKQLIERKDC